MPPDTRRPIVPDKKCPKCLSEPVTVATEMPYVTYYRCSTCNGLWFELHPPGVPPIKAIGDRIE